MSAHITDIAPIGTFYQAVVTEESGALWLDTFAYWLADEQGNKLARDIDAGIINEASIGWSWENAQCSVCGEDWYDYECPHWPGQTYSVVTDPETRETEERLCFLWMLDCTFDEGSVVYRGGHPDTKVGGALAANTFVPILSGASPSPGEQAPHLTHFQLQATRDMAGLYQKAKPKSELGKPTPPVEPETTQEALVKLKLKMPDGSVKELEENELQGLLDAQLQSASEGGEQKFKEAVAKTLGLEPKDVTDAKLAELKTQAAAGLAYRESLNTRLSAAALAVEGDPAKAERITKLAKNAELSDLEGLVTDWETKRDDTIPNGRLSREVPETETHVPDYDSN